MIACSSFCKREKEECERKRGQVSGAEERGKREPGRI